MTKTFISAGDLGNVDYIAIGVSLGITVFILAVVVYFLWRARNRSSMGTNNMNGHVSIKLSTPLLILILKKVKRHLFCSCFFKCLLL